MQISSILRSGSSRSYNLWRLVRGFTLIELLISLAIITLLSAVVIVRFSVFDSTTLLKSTAYEIASVMREAQVYSVSVLGADPDFDAPFGVSFSLGAPKQYTFFRYTGSADPPRFDTNATVVREHFLGRSLEVMDICVEPASGGLLCSSDGVTGLDISFKRPDFDALYYPSGVSGSFTNAQIKLHSTAPNTLGNVWVVEVGLLGAISVCKEGDSNCI